MSSGTGELAATVQAGHIRADPDPSFALAPSTAADGKEPALLGPGHGHVDDAAHDDGDIPYSVLRPPPRRRALPPLPDLRFEQSYLHSIANADSWWKVLLITARDQIVMPLVQGLLYNLLLCGWQHWNRNARLRGNTAGARLGRWWYGVNNRAIPGRTKHNGH